MAAYFLFDNVEVHDPDALARYAEQAGRLVAEHGGRYLAAAVAPEVVEGDPGLRSVVLIEFPDADSARAWYESPAYRPLKALRQRAVRNNAVLFEGLSGGSSMPVHELRVAVTATDYDEALVFYRDVLGLPEREAFASEDGRVTILEAGRATLELLDPTHAAFVDEVEVGRRVAGHVRIAFEVDDSTATTRALEAAGATVVAEPTRTPWDSMNARLEGPAGLQLTLFTESG